MNKSKLPKLRKVQRKPRVVVQKRVKRPQPKPDTVEVKVQSAHDRHIEAHQKAALAREQFLASEAARAAEMQAAEAEKELLASKGPRLSAADGGHR